METFERVGDEMQCKAARGVQLLFDKRVRSLRVSVSGSGVDVLGTCSNIVWYPVACIGVAGAGFPFSFENGLIEATLALPTNIRQALFPFSFENGLIEAFSRIAKYYGGSWFPFSFENGLIEAQAGYAPGLPRRGVSVLIRERPH